VLVVSSFLRVGWSVGGTSEQQIPSGNDRKKSKSNSRFPTGMEERKATARAKAKHYATTEDDLSLKMI
jgi:hypothetical protein